MSSLSTRHMTRERIGNVVRFHVDASEVQGYARNSVQLVSDRTGAAVTLNRQAAVYGDDDDLAYVEYRSTHGAPFNIHLRIWND